MNGRSQRGRNECGGGLTVGLGAVKRMATVTERGPEPCAMTLQISDGRENAKPCDSLRCVWNSKVHFAFIVVICASSLS